jgi:hypothetical protein
MCLGGVGRAGGDAGRELGMKGLVSISTRLARAAPNLYIISIYYIYIADYNYLCSAANSFDPRQFIILLQFLQ